MEMEKKKSEHSLIGSYEQLQKNSLQWTTAIESYRKSEFADKEKLCWFCIRIEPQIGKQITFQEDNLKVFIKSQQSEVTSNLNILHKSSFRKIKIFFKFEKKKMGFTKNVDNEDVYAIIDSMALKFPKWWQDITHDALLLYG